MEPQGMCFGSRGQGQGGLLRGLPRVEQYLSTPLTLEPPFEGMLGSVQPSANQSPLPSMEREQLCRYFGQRIMQCLFGFVWSRGKCSSALVLCIMSCTDTVQFLVSK
eukprot:RCo040015